MAALGYLAELKRDLGLAFGAHFLHDKKISLFNILSMCYCFQTGMKQAVGVH